MTRIRNDLNIYESEALSRLILIEQKDTATDDNEKTKIQQQIDDINAQLKQLAASIRTAGRLLTAYEKERSKLKSVYFFYMYFSFCRSNDTRR
jgi:hypothetical protein